MFGELVGAALADCWDRGRARRQMPSMSSSARAAARWPRMRCGRCARPGFAGDVASRRDQPGAARAQAERCPSRWHDDDRRTAATPRCCSSPTNSSTRLPVRQWVGGEERRVTIEGEQLRFTVDGAIREDSPARDAVGWRIARHLAAHGGVALIVDYGHARSGVGDTLQAVRGIDMPIRSADPGERDLTAHVDFEARAQGGARQPERAVDRAGRAGRLARSDGHRGSRRRACNRQRPSAPTRSPAVADRLCARTQMGRLFKVMALVIAVGPSRRGSDMSDRLPRRRRRRCRTRWRSSAARSFIETFGHLLLARRSRRLPGQSRARTNWRQELADPAFAVRHRRGRRQGGRLTPRSGRRSCRSSRAARPSS